jgi:hypothetical protein
MGRKHLNSRVESIKFTLEWSYHKVNFLDTTVELRGNKLVTDLYTKPTDSHNYLLYNSSHPQRCKDSIPYSQFLRVRRICSSVTDFDTHVVTLQMYFIIRGYPMKLLEEAATLARQKDRSRLLESTREVQVNDQKDKVFLITTFHPTDQALRQIVLKNWDLLGKSPTTSFLHEKKLMVGYRRPKNLRDILVKANVPFQPGDEKARPEALQD